MSVLNIGYLFASILGGILGKVKASIMKTYPKRTVCTVCRKRRYIERMDKIDVGYLRVAVCKQSDGFSPTDCRDRVAHLVRQLDPIDKTLFYTIFRNK